MGKYAEVIGRVPGRQATPSARCRFSSRLDSFRVTLADGTRWAKDADLGDGVLGDLRRAVRERFGGTIVRLDYNRDGRPDLLVLGAVVRDGKLGDLLLRNDGGGRFTDVTAQAGLADVPASFGCSVADFDNDGLPDLLFTGPAGVRLFRNVDGTRFEDKTAAAGLRQAVRRLSSGPAGSTSTRTATSTCWWRATPPRPEAALARLKGAGAADDGELLVFLNMGEAPPRPPGRQAARPDVQVPTRDRGRRRCWSKGRSSPSPPSDLDADRDVDLVVLADGQAPVAVLNDRLLRFHRDTGLPVQAAEWNGALVFDAQPRRAIRPAAAPGRPQADTPARAGATRRPRARRPVHRGGDGFAAACAGAGRRLDLDGWTDVLGLSQAREPVLLHNDGTGRLVFHRDTLANIPHKGNDLLAVAACDLDGDGLSDVLHLVGGETACRRGETWATATMPCDWT